MAKFASKDKTATKRTKTCLKCGSLASKIDGKYYCPRCQEFIKVAKAKTKDRS